MNLKKILDIFKTKKPEPPPPPVEITLMPVYASLSKCFFYTFDAISLTIILGAKDGGKHIVASTNDIRLEEDPEHRFNPDLYARALLEVKRAIKRENAITITGHYGKDDVFIIKKLQIQDQVFNF